MDDLRIPKISVDIVCHTIQNETLSGTIFLDMLSSSGYTVANVQEFFDSPFNFVPFRTQAGESILLQKQAILRADVPGLFHEYESEVSSLLDTRKEATLHFLNSDAVQGIFIIDLPSDHARVLDLLNTGHRFVPFMLEEMLTLINTRHIYKVEEK
jgi:hypothetical protein